MLFLVHPVLGNISTNIEVCWLETKISIRNRSVNLEKPMLGHLSPQFVFWILSSVYLCQNWPTQDQQFQNLSTMKFNHNSGKFFVIASLFFVKPCFILLHFYFSSYVISFFPDLCWGKKPLFLRAISKAIKSKNLFRNNEKYTNNN